MARRLVWLALLLAVARPADGEPLREILRRPRCVDDRVGDAVRAPAGDPRPPARLGPRAPGPPSSPASPPAAGTVPPPQPFAAPVFILTVEVRGNTVTADRLIRRALGVAPGDCLSPDDARLRAARYKVLALGYFRDVSLRFEKGGMRGTVILVVDVVERGTLVLNRMFFGTSQTSPWWAGLDLGDRNFLGSGIGVSGAFVYAGAGEQAGADEQRAFAVRLDDPSILGSAIGAHAALHYVDASEPYRTGGDFADGSSANFAAFDVRRIGGRAGATINVTALARLSLTARVEAVRARLPQGPRRALPGGGSVPVDLLLEPGDSRIATLAVGLDRDSRPDPVLPYTGTHLAVQLEAGAPPSAYTFVSLLARAERWWQVAERHVVSLHGSAGAVFGDAPRFDRLYVGELNRMLSPRALGLVMSSTTALDVFATGADEVVYGELGGVAEVQYAFRLFRSRRHVFGGDLFVGAGLWSLAERRRLRDEPLADALSVDLLLDVGVRLDSEIGIFELSLANGLGRIPL